MKLLAAECRITLIANDNSTSFQVMAVSNKP